MITKGIVEQIIDPYSIRVRIPYYDKIASAPTGTATQDLSIATISSLPNCKMNYAIGDIVFIGFEDHCIDKPVILGQLSRPNCTNQNTEMLLNSLNVSVDTHLTADTTIGEVTGNEIRQLKGIKQNIQFQLDTLEVALKALVGTSDGEDGADIQSLVNTTKGITNQIKILNDNVAKLQEVLKEKADKYVPSGMISIWHGNVNDIPEGWILCDGTNNTVDLRDKFIIGSLDDTVPIDYDLCYIMKN